MGTHFVPTSESAAPPPASSFSSSLLWPLQVPNPVENSPHKRRAHDLPVPLKHVSMRGVSIAIGRTAFVSSAWSQ